METTIRVQETMNVKKKESADSLLQIMPDTALACVLQCLDAKGLNAVSKTSKYFNMFMPCSGLRLTEHIARNRVLELLHGDNTAAERFKYALLLWSIVALRVMLLTSDAYTSMNTSQRNDILYRTNSICK